VSAKTIPPAVDRRERSRGTARRLLTTIGYPLALIIVCLLLWQWIVKAFDISTVVLPAPTQVFDVIKESPGLLLRYSRITGLEIVIGFLIATGVGVPVGAAIFFSARVKKAIYPLLVSSQMVPKVALAPIFLIWFGSGSASKYLVAFLVAFFPIVISTTLGLESVEPDMVRLFRSMGASTLETMTKLRIPMALPSLFGGLKVAMTLAVVGAVVGEFVAADAGLGYYILFSNGMLNTAAVYAGLFAITLLGVVLYFLVELAEFVLVPRGNRHRDRAPEATM
jgi:NitT/TauT family transport system permease protein